MTVISRRIAGATHNLGAPPNWDRERDGNCGQLWIRQQDDYVESAWEITPDDIERLKQGRSLIVRIYGWQPPIAIYVDPKESQHEPL